MLKTKQLKTLKAFKHFLRKTVITKTTCLYIFYKKVVIYCFNNSHTLGIVSTSKEYKCDLNKS